MTMHNHPIQPMAIKKILIIPFTFLFLFALIGCAINPVTGTSQLMLVSEQEEIEMGKNLYPNAMWGAEGGGGEYRDEQLKAYLKNIVLNIHKVSHRPNLPVAFAIQNSSVPNAWAIPGYVVITRGLLTGLDNEAEFAYVMGHEMGHVSARHSASQISYGMLTQVVLAGAGVALTGSDYSDIALTLGSVGGSLLLLKYSRDDELEADRLGVSYMTKLGYSPKNALSAHRNLERVSNEYIRSLGQEPQERGFFEDLLSTHPRTSVRIEELQHIINTTQPVAVRGDGTNRNKFQTSIGDIKSINNVYLEYYDKAVRALKKGNTSEASSLVSKAIAKNKTQPPFHALNGFIMLKNKNYESAKGSFNNALRLDNNYQPAYRGLGAIHYLQKNYAEGIQYLKKSISLFPEDVPSHYFLGMSYFKTKAYTSAIPHLKLFAQAQPKHPSIHGVLGICYEGVNDLSSAYNEYALQLKVNPNNEMGKQATSRVEVLRQRIR